MYRCDNNKDQHFIDSIVHKKNSIADGGVFHTRTILFTKPSRTTQSQIYLVDLIVKRYNIRRRYKLLGLFILWTLLWTIFSKSGLYEHYYNKRKIYGHIRCMIFPFTLCLFSLLAESLKRINSLACYHSGRCRSIPFTPIIITFFTFRKSWYYRYYK